MKKFLTLLAFGVLATLGFHQPAMANCYCEQGVISGDACLVPRSVNSSSPTMMPIGRPICPAVSRPKEPERLPMQERCYATKQTPVICEYYSPYTGGLEMVIGKNDAGKELFVKSFSSGILTHEMNYDGKGNRTNEVSYAGGQISRIVIHTGKTSEEVQYYDNGQLYRIDYHSDNVTKRHSVGYHNNKKHGTEYEMILLKNNRDWTVIRQATWLNGQKHGEEKFFELVNKRGKTKLVKTVMWQHGKMIQ